MNDSSVPDPSATESTRRRYQRLSPFYDAMEGLAEPRYHPWREKLWSLVPGLHMLEFGVGTGKNMPSYPTGISITAIDLTPGLLQRAYRKAAGVNSGSKVNLHLGDIQKLDFPDNAFDSTVTTIVFCSVPDPIVGALKDFLNPQVVGLMGVNINRRTVDNIRRVGLEIEQVEDLGLGGIFNLIMARVPAE